MRLHIECLLCGRDDDECDCPTCGYCGAVGDPFCYQRAHDVPYAHDSIQRFCDHIGIEPVSSALRAIDKHNAESVYLVLWDGRRVYYTSREWLYELDKRPYTRIKALGVTGIAWDGTDWEWTQECSAGGDWSALDETRAAFQDALEEHMSGEE